MSGGDRVAARRVARGALWTAALMVACRSGAGSERLGDEAYGAARYREALSAYQKAVKDAPSARVWAKVGAAALRAGDLTAAIDAYLRLAGEDPTRTDEAAQGIEIAARAAERAGDDRALQAAVSGLEVVAPDRVGGGLVLALARRPGSDAADLARFLPEAVAAATDPQTVDSLLARYALALRETSGCDAAMPIYHAVQRRSRDSTLLRAAEDGITRCTDTLGVPAVSDSMAGSVADSLADSTR